MNKYAHHLLLGEKHSHLARIYFGLLRVLVSLTTLQPHIKYVSE